MKPALPARQVEGYITVEKLPMKCIAIDTSTPQASLSITIILK